MSAEVVPAALSVGWVTCSAMQAYRLRQARRDPLTRAWTRTAFERRARRQLHVTKQALVVLADLDAFKQINDSHGHATGDQALRTTAHRLRCWAEHGVVGRLGGDELVAVRPLTAFWEPSDLVQMLHRQLQIDVYPAGPAGFWGQVRVSSSVGAVLVGRGTPVSVALTGADTAMYTAKRESDGLGWHLCTDLREVPGRARRYKRTGPEGEAGPTAVGSADDRRAEVWS